MSSNPWGKLGFGAEWVVFPRGSVREAAKTHSATSAGVLCVLLLHCVSCGSTPSTPVPPVSSADWPMYGHDTSRTNYNAAEKTLSATNVAALAQAWQADIGSNGNPSSSAPVVANGLVFVGSSVDSGNNLFAFDATTGAPVWAAGIGHLPPDAPGPCGGVGIGSTASVVAGVLVIGGGDRAFYGLQAASGALLWRRALTGGPSSFAWASPLVASGRAFLGTAAGCDNPSVRGELTAVDAGSGSLLADQYFAPPGVRGAGVWNSPALSPDGTFLFVATGEDNGDGGPYEQAMVSLDPQSLAILGASSQGDIGQDLDFASTPVVFSDAGGRVLVGAGHKDGNFYTFLASSVGAGPLWSRAVGPIYGFAPAYDPSTPSGGTLFFGGTDGQGNQIHAADPATGADRWVAGVGQTGGNLAVANGLVFVATGDGRVIILNEQTGEPLRTLVAHQPGPSYTGVTVAQGTVFWLSGSILNAWRPGS